MTAGATPPIVIDLGKTTKKRIKRLKQGRGRLTEEVQQAIGEVAAQLSGDAAEAKLLPVVVVYRRKEKKRKRRGFFPLPF